MKGEYSISITLPVDQKTMYEAWLNSKQHSAFTGSPANIDSTKGGLFTAWDGYISGENMELQPYHRILQTWRTSDFSDKDPDSSLEILIDKNTAGCKVTLVHRNIPEGKGLEYKKGWQDFYFKPMKEYFKK